MNDSKRAPTEPHLYSPNYQMMGDCDVCGNIASHPLHTRYEQPALGSHWTQLDGKGQYRVEVVSSHPVTFVKYVTYRPVQGGFCLTVSLDEWVIHYKPLQGQRELRDEEKGEFDVT